MKILLTGAFKYSKDDVETIENMGNECFFIEDEKAQVNIDKTEIEAIVCNVFFLYHDIKEYKNLKYIQLTSAGLDRVPLEYIKENNIQIHNARGVYSIPMAEWAICKILDVYKKSAYFIENQKNHIWNKNRSLIELYNKKVMIFGFGSIGSEIAKRLKAFGTQILAVNKNLIESEYIDESIFIEDAKNRICDVDIVISTLPLTSETENFFNSDIFKEMRDGSILVNISRGKIIKQDDLILYLNTNKFLGVILDVFEEEPLSEESKLWNYNNVIISPHNSFVSEGNNKRMLDVIINNLKNSNL